MHEQFIGIDFGYSKIGIAIGQTVTNTASPICTISAKKGIPNWNNLNNIINTWKPTKIIIGLPIDLKEKDTFITRQTRVFAKQIKNRYNRPVYFISEVFSTYEAKCIMKKKMIDIDAIAACIILETWLNEV